MFTSALIGASKPEQVEENVKASGINLLMKYSIN